MKHQNAPQNPSKELLHRDVLFAWQTHETKNNKDVEHAKMYVQNILADEKKRFVDVIEKQLSNLTTVSLNR